MIGRRQLGIWIAVAAVLYSSRRVCSSLLRPGPATVRSHDHKEHSNLRSLLSSTQSPPFQR